MKSGGRPRHTSAPGFAPLNPGYDRTVMPGWSSDFISSAFQHALLPAITFVLANIAGWILGMRNAMITTLSEDYVLMGLAPSLYWLFAAQCLTGTFSATSGTAYAYVSDITDPAERSRRFGMIGAAFGTGLVIGPVLGGLLIEYGLRVPFFTAAALSLGNVLFGALVVPESLLPANRRTFRWSRANPLGALLELRRQLADGLRELRVDRVAAAAGRRGVVRLIQNQEAPA